MLPCNASRLYPSHVYTAPLSYVPVLSSSRCHCLQSNSTSSVLPHVEHALAAAKDKETYQIHKHGREDGARNGNTFLWRGILVASDKLLVPAAVHDGQHGQDNDGEHGYDGDQAWPALTTGFMAGGCVCVFWRAARERLIRSGSGRTG
ncbi:hypothetical protein IF1G_10708 [Cordyceps javanica]|uniref:Uncharacterized protein n=1 Tax=Cordyceps javanica TaxID=43265 RepID=A0A545UM60_9HYPO|nr:hypothetical protein IF1G_10708 [Cordyceps javanica]